MRLLKGKKAFITGATSGIGKAIATTFVENGASVVFSGTNLERGALVKEELKQIAKENEKIEFLPMDIASFVEVESKLKEILKEVGCFDIIVNCAGTTRDKLLMSMSEEDWDVVLDTNLKSVYNVVHCLLRPMIKAKAGKIINISSVIGLTGNPGQVNYSSSKFGMIGFTKSLAREVSSRGINVNAIAPGFIQTKMTDALNDKQKEEILGRIPMKKLGDVKDIANAALFLASSLSDYITGEVITVDGGMLA
ncbi:MAG: 3-oxoacyl-[acyl-carrier-protein] reductase [Chlamydiales bacterium]|nr:3-oxoacyl-[acyl-carrier-protein] reductase [Chlamydiales bacterium]